EGGQRGRNQPRIDAREHPRKESRLVSPDGCARLATKQVYSAIPARREKTQLVPALAPTAGRCGAQPVAFGRPRAHGRRRARRPHVQAGRAVYFGRMTDDNLDALVAWVRTIPPLDWVSNESEHARRRVLRTGNRKISRRRPARSLALARAFVAAVIHALAG